MFKSKPYHTLGQYQGVVYLPDDIGRDLQKYRATLGHKINHSFLEPNCIFIPYHHARFGLINAIKSTRDIEKGEELLCHYNIPYDISPSWYQEKWRKGNIFICI